ncbi:MAG: helix-turn-helix domain-containing protein [Thermaerobacter sp.]|nr:helix-turn-helix domain-containing protein [Thermaerobacter sp.]
MRSQLREWRQRRGYTQQQLAERAGVTRQTVGGLESGQYGPGLDVALRLARALGCAVEDLFLPEQDTALATPLGAHPGGDRDYRVALAEIGGRTVARPLRGLGVDAPAHGIARPHDGGGLLRVERFPGVGRGLFLAGCDPALGLLSGHIERSAGRIEALWWNAGNRAALSQLERSEVHAAAVHQPQDGAGIDAFGLARFRLCNWQMGFITAQGNPRGIQGAGDLSRADIRLVNRERGAGARELLDRLLPAHGLQPSNVQGYRQEVTGHRQVAEAIALGAADVGIGHAGAAEEYRLGFIPIADEVCDLLLAHEALTQPEIAALLEVLRSGAFRTDLAAFGPYDTTRTGDRIA